MGKEHETDIHEESKYFLVCFLNHAYLPLGQGFSLSRENEVVISIEALIDHYIAVNEDYVHDALVSEKH